MWDIITHGVKVELVNWRRWIFEVAVCTTAVLLCWALPRLAAPRGHRTLHTRRPITSVVTSSLGTAAAKHHAMRCIQHQFLLSALLAFTVVQSRYTSDEYASSFNSEDEDTCADAKCTVGEYCKEGKCHCYDFCPSDWLIHQSKICVDGYTYSHTCDLYRNICYCREGDPRCGDERYFNGHRADSDSIIRYFAECQELTTKCNWAVQRRYFRYQFILWLQQLLRSRSYGTDPRNVLLRPRSEHDWLALDSLLAKHIGRNGENAGPLLSFVFCELDVDKNGMIEERELAMLTQVALPTLACLEIFLGNCISGRTISRDTWFNCFEIDSRDTMLCSNFV